MKITLITMAEYLKRTKYWILKETDWCPACMTEDTYYTRVLYSERPKPDDINQRDVWHETYNYCDI